MYPSISHVAPHQLAQCLSHHLRRTRQVGAGQRKRHTRHILSDSPGSKRAATPLSLTTEITFTPGRVTGGNYQFSIGTAGSTTLVLQTILLPLALAPMPSMLVLEGGTHNPLAPPYDFLERVYLPLLNRMGPYIEVALERPGFYPAGGGRMNVAIMPAESLEGITLLERGEMQKRRAQATIANLPVRIAERELRVIQERLGWDDGETEIVDVHNSPGPGNIVTIEIAHAHVNELFCGLGEVRRSAEAVATHAIQQYQRYLKSEAPAGEYLTDQLMLPLAIAGKGAFRSTELSLHAETHAELIGRFLPVTIDRRRHDNGDVTLTFA